MYLKYFFATACKHSQPLNFTHDASDKTETSIILISNGGWGRGAEGAFGPNLVFGKTIPPTTSTRMHHALHAETKKANAIKFRPFYDSAESRIPLSSQHHTVVFSTSSTKNWPKNIRFSMGVNEIRSLSKKKENVGIFSANSSFFLARKKNVITTRIFHFIWEDTVPVEIPRLLTKQKI